MTICGSAFSPKEDALPHFFDAMDMNMNRTVSSRRIVKDGKVVEDVIEERVQSSEGGPGVRAGDLYESLRAGSVPAVVPSLGKSAGRVSLACGGAAMFFALMPLVCGWFVALFWLLYLFGFVSLVTAVVAFARGRVAAPLSGLAMSVAAVVTAYMCAHAYAVAAAGSVNRLTGLARTFIDALEWPF